MLMRTLLLILAGLLALLATTAHAESPYSNLTVLTYDPQHGTQVEYFDKSSAWTFLWYPGNGRVETGQVLTATGPKMRPQLCFRYGPQIYEPLMPDSGGWQCISRYEHEQSIRDTAKGDVFNLSSGRIPYVLPPEAANIRALRRLWETLARQ
jgi:hypothetical protein